MNRIWMKLIFLALGALSLLALGTAPSARACSVPVFRYALERWENSPYRIVILHKGAYGEKDAGAVAELKAVALNENPPSNVSTEEIDVESELALAKNVAVARFWRAQKDPVLPFVLLLYPNAEDEFQVAWRGPLAAGLAKALTVSPARTEITRRLVAGDSAVWVLLEGSDAGKNEAAAKTLKATLETLRTEIQLPSDDDSQGGPQVRLRSEIPLKISFTMLRVKRDDPAEAFFAGMLSGTEAKAKDASKPTAFGIFGRGRSLTGLVGDEIKESIIRDACYFFAGACSCQVKELNPGIDLLYAFDWEGALRGDGEAPKNDAKKVETQGEAAKTVTPVTVPIPSGPTKMTAPVVVVNIDFRRELLWCCAILAGLAVVLSGMKIMGNKTK